MSRYAIGVDFGTGSGRAILVDVADGSQLATAVEPYRNGVIDEHLPAPDEAVVLPPDWALQDPDDYLRVLQTAVPEVVRAAGVDPADVIGIGIDFTACTMLPATADGTALCQLPGVPVEPACLGQALEAPRRPARCRPDQRGRTVDGRGLAGPLRRQDLVGVVLLEGAPDPRRGARGLRGGGSADRGGRLGRLAAHRRRDPQRLHRGLQGDVVQARRLPRPGLLRGTRPALRGRRRHEDAPRPVAAPASWPAASRPRRRGWTGLPAGTAVAVANVDAHVAVPAATVTGPGTMVMIMGTSTCHMVLSRDERTVPGHVRLRRGRHHPGLLRLRGRPVVRRRSLRVVRRAGPAGGLPRRGSQPAASTSTASSRRRPRASRSASRGSSRSTGGTGTDRSWSTRRSAACWSG